RRLRRWPGLLAWRCGDHTVRADHRKRVRKRLGMQRRKLGDLEVSAVGLGCATMTPFYDEPDRDGAIRTIRRAREIGVDFLDSSDAYGRGRNEELIARGVEGHRDEY